ncbi:MAG: cupin domain-containing protein [Lentisphaerae bacterium]|nr:cupin domain-containing protein [Lentisphaerota bacterium]
MTGAAFAPAESVSYADGSIVSRTLLEKETGSLTLFAFDRGQGLSEHTSPYDATVYILDGTATLKIGGEPIDASAGEMVIMPANVPHDVRAEKGRFKMLLVMIR